MEMEPGPANIGMANGVSETSERVSISACTLLRFIPLCLANEPVNNEKPEEAITNPPARRRELTEIPKKDKTYFPTKNEMSNIARTLIAVQSDVLSRLCLLSSLVKPTNTGTVPRGLMTENKAAKMMMKSSIVFAAKVALDKEFIDDESVKFELGNSVL